MHKIGLNSIKIVVEYNRSFSYIHHIGINMVQKNFEKEIKIKQIKLFRKNIVKMKRSDTTKIVNKMFYFQ
jgi:hypothetical protein